MPFAKYRSVVLMGILLGIIAIVLIKPSLIGSAWFAGAPSAPANLLPGVDAIHEIKVSRKDGIWYADVGYFNRGGDHAGHIEVLTSDPQGEQSPNRAGQVELARRGEGSVRVEVDRPPLPANAHRTSGVTAILRTISRPEVRKEVAFPIDWPDALAYQNIRAEARRSDRDRLAEAIDLIDHGSSRSLEQARRLLERILLANPQFIDAYPELARYSMKHNWGEEGLEHAEKYLLRGLELQPDHANSHVLLGYVYAHLRRFDAAEQALDRAAEIGTPNLWLWANWGELRLMQQREADAIAKYLRAVDQPRPYNTYDRAQLDAYRHLLIILGDRGEQERLQALYERRATEFTTEPCFRSDYARYLVFERGDFATGIMQAERALKEGCQRQGTRDVMGVAHYMAWSVAEPAGKAGLLSKARIFLPEGPRLYYLLSTSDKTAGALDAVDGDGRVASSRDGENLTALAHALAQADQGAARRLLERGASLTDPVGAEGIQTALIPVFNEDLETLEFVLRNGIDPAILQYRGASLVEHAQASGNERLLELLRRVPRRKL